MKKKYAFIAGASGGIGKGFAEYLHSRGFHVVLQFRTQKTLEECPITNSVTKFISALNNQVELEAQLTEFMNQGIFFDVIVLAAGKFAWDYEFGSVPDAIMSLREANLATKVVTVSAFEKIYGLALKNTTLVIISSHAAKFGADHPFRVNEEGYCLAMEAVSEFGHGIQDKNTFWKVIVEEPGRVGTESAKSSFNQETIGQDVDWEKEITAFEYAKEVYAKIEL